MRLFGCLCCIALLSACAGAPRQHTFVDPVIPDRLETDMRVHFVNIGSGSCQLIECPNGTSVTVIDCGSSSTKRVMSKPQVADYVRKIVNGKKISFSVSHPDADHYNYLPYIFNKDILDSETEFRSIVIGGDRLKGYNQDFTDWVKKNFQQSSVIANLGLNYYSDKDRDKFNINERLGCFDEDEDEELETTTKILMANAYSYSKSNANTASIVLWIQYNEDSLFFPGDGTIKTWRAMSDTYPVQWPPQVGTTGPTTVVAMVHHGAYTDRNKENDYNALIKNIEPLIAVGQSGSKNNHVTCTTLQNYYEYPKIYFSQSHIVYCDGDGPPQNGLDPTFSPEPFEAAIYDTWSNGNVIIDIDGDRGAEVYCLRTVPPYDPELTNCSIQ